MKFKDFIKGNAFKCIIVLTVVALISGGLLAILNDVLAISAEERTERAIKNIYGSKVAYETVAVKDEFKTNEFGSIQDVYKIEGSNYLIKSTGTNGYKGGSITTWVVAKFENNVFTGIEKVTIADNEKQTLMQQFNAKFLAKYATTDAVILNGGYFSIAPEEGNLTAINSGATKSSNACNRAVNSALCYIRAALV